LRPAYRGLRGALRASERALCSRAVCLAQYVCVRLPTAVCCHDCVVCAPAVPVSVALLCHCAALASAALPLPLAARKASATGKEKGKMSDQFGRDYAERLGQTGTRQSANAGRPADAGLGSAPRVGAATSAAINNHTSNGRGGESDRMLRLLEIAARSMPSAPSRSSRLARHDCARLQS
jgi:hypothetical protein